MAASAQHGPEGSWLIKLLIFSFEEIFSNICHHYFVNDTTRQWRHPIILAILLSTREPYNHHVVKGLLQQDSCVDSKPLPLDSCIFLVPLLITLLYGVRAGKDLNVFKRKSENHDRSRYSIEQNS